MDHITTTHTAVQKLKREAKQRSKASHSSLNSALEEVARESGYVSWKHVTVCLATSQSLVNKEGQQVLALGDETGGVTIPAVSAVHQSRGRPVIVELDVRRLQAGFYEYRAVNGGHELYTDAGFSSIADALRSASDVTGDIRGFEVCYGGVVVGTYPVQELHETADVIAAHAVRTAGAFVDQ